MVGPERLLTFSVRTRVFVLQLLEYDDVNETARPPAELFPPYELKDFSWSRLNASDPTAPLCGTPGNFTAGSLCLRVCWLSW